MYQISPHPSRFPNFVYWRSCHVTVAFFQNIQNKQFWNKLLSSIFVYRNDDESSGASHVSPHALAACMRIDSCIKTSLIPETRLVATFNAITINFHNDTHLLGTCKSSHPYSFQINAVFFYKNLNDLIIRLNFIS